MKRSVAAVAVALVAACSGGEVVTNQPPVAIVPNDIDTQPGVVEMLNGGASKDPDGTIVSYHWSFGDGAEADGAAVQHAWQTADLFVVQLTVTDDLGATDTAALRVSTSTTSNLNQMPVAAISGPARGMPNETLTFDGSASADADGTIASYRWTFGDGATAEGASVSHAWASEGSFTVTLVVQDDGGALGQASRAVVIGTIANNTPPIADAGPAVSGEIGSTVTVDGSASTDPDGAIVGYAWDLGDGSTASTPRVEHAYGQAGTYTVTLTVTDDAGATADDTTTVTIAPPVSYDGTWLFNPTQGVQTCTNSRRTYQVPFPITRLAISGTETGTVTADVVGAMPMRTMSGSVDRSTSPPAIALSWQGAESEGTCGTAMVRHVLSGGFNTETTIAGRLTVIYNWSNAFCNCSRSFDFTGARQ